MLNKTNNNLIWNLEIKNKIRKCAELKKQFLFEKFNYFLYKNLNI